MLDQTLVACYSDRATAELGRKFVLEHSRVNASKDAIVDAPDAAKLRSLMPDAYVADVQGRMERGEAVWVVRVDETAAFTVRGLIEEETRQRWTLAVPPEVAHG